jgi:pimeloyl-ACP methyl ester carboxylesterase
MQDAVVFLHSTGTGPFMWKRFLQAVPEGMQVVTPTNRGYAPDDLFARGQPFEIDMDLAHVKAQLPQGAAGLHLVAHSYGGLLALTLALDASLPVRSIWLYEPVLFGSMKLITDDMDPETAAQVQALYDTPDFIGNVSEGGDEAWLARFVDYWSQPGVWAAMPDKVKQLNRAVGWKMFQEVRSQALLFRPVSDYQYAVPMTLVHGGLSPRPAGEMVRQLARHNPQSHVHTLAELGHMAVVTQADAVLPAFQAHWDRLVDIAR